MFHCENNPPRFSPQCTFFFRPWKIFLRARSLETCVLCSSAAVVQPPERECVCACVFVHKYNLFPENTKRLSETLMDTHLLWWRSERSWPLGAVRAQEVRESLVPFNPGLDRPVPWHPGFLFVGFLFLALLGWVTFYFLCCFCGFLLLLCFLFVYGGFFFLNVSACVVYFCSPTRTHIHTHTHTLFVFLKHTHTLMFSETHLEYSHTEASCPNPPGFGSQLPKCRNESRS